MRIECHTPVSERIDLELIRLKEDNKVPNKLILTQDELCSLERELEASGMYYELYPNGLVGNKYMGMEVALE